MNINYIQRIILRHKDQLTPEQIIELLGAQSPKDFKIKLRFFLTGKIKNQNRIKNKKYIFAVYE